MVNAGLLERVNRGHYRISKGKKKSKPIEEDKNQLKLF